LQGPWIMLSSHNSVGQEALIRESTYCLCNLHAKNGSNAPLLSCIIAVAQRSSLSRNCTRFKNNASKLLVLPLVDLDVTLWASFRFSVSTLVPQRLNHVTQSRHYRPRRVVGQDKLLLISGTFDRHPPWGWEFASQAGQSFGLMGPGRFE